ncbi:MAG: hypothetical protein M1827_003271 [Pycnora praestabilis]|nr:MAG: hypothetical protein M1827_003271 [Pycnora praestabilis]
MGVVASLPILSFLMIPSMGSYSTSLNLLFFYMTWSTLILSHSPLNIELLGTLAIRALFFILPSTLFLIFDSAIPSVAVNLKAQGEVALPVRTSSGEEKRSKRTPWWAVVALAVLNILMGVALQAGVEYLFTEVIKIRSALKVTTTLPMPWGIAKDLARGLALREVMQYYIHRYALHSPSSPVASLHESWQHSIEAPYSFVAHFDHPLTWFLWRWLPTYGPAIIFRFHLLTYFLLLIIVSFEETFSFSGYSTLPSALILGRIARKQDIHLMSGGKGNFAPLGLMDWIHGTSIGSDVLEDMMDQIEESDAAELSKGASKGVKKAKKISGKKGKKRSDSTPQQDS